MKTAICYYSRHHGNTLKVLEAMAEVAGADLVDVTSRMAARLPQYDRIGFASGIYYSKFHDTVPLRRPVPARGQRNLFRLYPRLHRLPRKVLCRHHRSSKGQKLPHSWHLLLPRL